MPDITKQSDRTKIKFKKIFLIAGVAALPIGVLTVFTQVPPSCGCSDGSRETIGSFTRAQKAYFSEKSAFAESYRSLGLGDRDAPAATTRYRYSVEMNQEQSFIYATPTKDLPTDMFRIGLTKKGRSSLVGAVAYDKKHKSTVSIMCRSLKDTLDRPPKPVFQKGKFTCPRGFKSME
ncbi:MAG: type IV pilin-like G/H family protein [Aulosira sp. ZfuVER01]|nr:type IV pilin-like G/H family protein [Aulosira sp. ZfuVER01]MDZ7997453.1 type IV pilin-like G/H family protein [Aulosira sp. DedVER01a]MDZ8054518.1 type IV pilin-like G/H family protein [Aulosira sp. ZfuCHP01]